MCYGALKRSHSNVKKRYKEGSKNMQKAIRNCCMAPTQATVMYFFCMAWALDFLSNIGNNE